MKTWIKVIGTLVIVGLIALFVVYKFFYNKPHPDFENQKADFSVVASDLFQSYKDDNITAVERFNGKLLEVTGVLTKIDTPDDLTVAVFEFDEGMFGPEGVRITMLPEYAQPLINLGIGKEITIKGFCTGYNETDVILEKGSIVN
ncbi:MAG: hypothetical protein IH598_06130 [Bacteroidales bacterium]|nr:hypothetical protein [Bacteroidales bacterium]